MKIVFIGTVAFSRLTLKKLIEMGEDVRGVCTKENSLFNSDFADLTECCRENNIPYKYVADINSKESIDWITTLKPDVILCFGWSSLIKKELLAIPSMGIVGFHPAALPQNKGRHPLIWALALGLEQTASTFFMMNEGADEGDIISQQKIPIFYHDNASTLYQRTVESALKQIEDFIPRLKSGNLARIPQDNTSANSWRKRGRQDGQIDFRMSSRAIYNLVRALSEPYVGAHILYHGTEIKVWDTEEIDFNQSNIEPGFILSNTDGILVKTYDGAIKLKRHGFDTLPEERTYL